MRGRTAHKDVFAWEYEPRVYDEPNKCERDRILDNLLGPIFGRVSRCSDRLGQWRIDHASRFLALHEEVVQDNQDCGATAGLKKVYMSRASRETSRLG